MPYGFPDWIAKKVEVWEKSDWSIMQGQSKNFYIGTNVPANDYKSVEVYTVPEGKMLFITDIGFLRETNVGTIIVYIVITKNLESQTIYGTAAQQGGGIAFKTPKIVPAGWTLNVGFWNRESNDSYMYATIGGFEVES